MALSYNLGYQESISVHPTRRQIFAGKTDSTFPNIWQWVVCASSEVFLDQMTSLVPRLNELHSELVVCTFSMLWVGIFLAISLLCGNEASESFLSFTVWWKCLQCQLSIIIAFLNTVIHSVSIFQFFTTLRARSHIHCGMKSMVSDS